jgi:hypothetical protein
MNETLFFFFASGEMWGQEFEGDKTIQFEVLGFVDDAHASTVKFFEDFVM